MKTKLLVDPKNPNGELRGGTPAQVYTGGRGRQTIDRNPLCGWSSSAFVLVRERPGLGHRRTRVSGLLPSVDISKPFDSNGDEDSVLYELKLFAHVYY